MRVELAVGLDDRFGLAGVAREQRVDGELDQRLRAFRHGEEPAVERGELVVKVPEWGFRGGHPNLPVM